MRCVVASLVLTLLTVSTLASVPLIQAPWGSIQGVRVEGDGGRTMNGYMGIPYAEPPVGELRFERPRPHPGPGEGQVFVADQIMTPCPQIPHLIGKERKTSEDCLKLDVYVPSEADGTARAVMVFIHGGGLEEGDAYSYRPSRLVSDGKVIVAVIQYRVAALGFLTSGDDALPGNMGLWDQNLALRWIKDNIPAFGGDPERVTIFGESAGSWSVGLHIISPQSKGLFQRGIMQSGAPQDMSTILTNIDMKAAFKEFAGLFECQGDNSRQLLDCLKQQPVDILFNKSVEFSATSPAQTYYCPYVDGEFIPRNMHELLRDPEFLEENGVNDMDLIAGFTNEEGGSFVIFMEAMMEMPPGATLTSDFFGTALEICRNVRSLPNNPILNKAAEFFYRRAETGKNTSENIRSVGDMLGDCMMNAPVLDWLHHLAASPRSAPLYFYVLDHDFNFNNQTQVRGAHHGDDLALLFDTEREIPEDSLFVTMNKTYITAQEGLLSDMLVDIWTNFAKTGNPNPPLQEALGREWPVFTNEDEEYLSITMSPHVVNKAGVYRDRVALWSNLLTQLKTLIDDMSSADTDKEQSPAKEEL